jgi:flagellar basal-body rod protein FlgC
MDLPRTLAVAAHGMAAQNTRLRVVAENMANANSLAPSPDADPYRRRTVTFGTVTDPASGAQLVQVRRIGPDRSEFGLRHEPGHPAADERGYVRTPNVNSMVEMADLREAQRSYNANLATFDAARAIATRTLDLLR